MSDQGEPPPLDDEELVRRLEAFEEQRAERSNAEWWEEDHLAGQRRDRLAAALDTLKEACRCTVGELLSDLREIEDLSGGYDFFLPDRRELPGIIKSMRALAEDIGRIEMSPLSQSLPGPTRLTSEALSHYANALEQARQATRRGVRPGQVRRIREFIAWVDGRVREHGTVGKGQADAALALLLTAVTGKKWTAAALRVQRARLNQRAGKKRIPKDKRPKVRRLRGSRARDRPPKFVRFQDELANENPLSDDGDELPDEFTDEGDESDETEELS